MESEWLTIFDDNMKPNGKATREEVHQKGYWHETFHCWFIRKEEEKTYIYFQIRSEYKKDYPNLLDITAAGHILSHETVLDGVREVKEELGIDISMDELVPLGVIPYSVDNNDIIDREMAHVFIYESIQAWNDFKLQKEEVSGILKIELSSFYKLWFGGKQYVPAFGFVVNQTGEKEIVKKLLTKADFVQHEDFYFKKVLNGIKAI
ncbi:isopentenyldiphosphate isomerase [Bacillus oleivorans]|uniref:Isopentenyldiphosphate isomerase n=1 Tax=Bacillus oleivorans TaxID=1448271 RepID=A0A285CLX4_9BACI|nr:NUDIX domain-containing protein [Bacillus oleivorans]SNX68541.1 isopentenyldiphosphate isomerase [Bacillus oleivorans]